MADLTRGRRTASAGAALLLAAGLAACGDGEQQKAPPPTTWSDAGASNASDKPGEQVEGGSFKVVPGQPWDLKLPEGSSAMVDPNTWPDVQKILSTDQLNGILPGKNLKQPTLCGFSNYDNGAGSTPKNAQCSWEIGGFGSDERIRLQLKGIGADSEVTKAWDSVRDKYRKENVADDAFYKDGTYGARRVLLRSSGLGSFVISDGQVAAWFDVQVPDADFLVSGNAPETRKQVRTQMFPTLVQTFVTFLPRKH